MEKILIIDLNRCVGCGACAVTCMDQNDIDLEQGQPAFRRIYQLEDGQNIQYVSAGCLHCQESPCLTGCPTGAIYRDDQTRAVLINQDLCIGCHSCALACPFGVPRYDANDKMNKCNLCSERVKNDYEPACVKVCPYNALRYDTPDRLQTDKELRFLGGLAGAALKSINVR